MKKFTIWILFLLATALLLSACSGNPATVSPGPAPTNAAPPAPTNAAPPAATSTAVNPIPTQMGYPAPGTNPVPTGYPAPAGGQPQPGYPAPGNGLQVAGTDGKLKTIAAAAIGGIAKGKVTVNGQEMQLRKVADLLTLAGIASYKTVTVVGGNGNMTLNSDQLAKAYLDVTDGGGINLVVDGVQPDRWISAVTQLIAQ